MESLPKGLPVRADVAWLSKYCVAHFRVTVGRMGFGALKQIHWKLKKGRHGHTIIEVADWKSDKLEHAKDKDYYKSSHSWSYQSNPT